MRSTPFSGLVLLWLAFTPFLFAEGRDSSPKTLLQYDFKTSAAVDPFNDPKGPFYHQILKAVSADGFNFQKEEGILFNHASVPDVVQAKNGRLFLYAVDATRRSRSGVMIAISADDGKNWEQGSLQLESIRGPQAGADPQIVRLEDGSFRLFYIVFNRPATPGVVDTKSENVVYSAISKDGIHFKEEDGIRFAYPQVTDPDVVLIKGIWWMYLSQGPQLIAATSTDGISFTYEALIRSEGSVSKTVQFDEKSWRQFFCDRGKGIRSALSSNGKVWYDDQEYRLEAEDDSMICDPSLVQIGSQWILFYKSQERHPYHASSS